jgi:predicted CopG family antitoxin
MATKTVALDQEAYELLRHSRKAGESFSQAVKRLARPRRPLSDFAGIWADMTAKERALLERTNREMNTADRRRSDLLAKLWE